MKSYNGLEYSGTSDYRFKRDWYCQAEVDPVTNNGILVIPYNNPWEMKPENKDLLLFCMEFLVRPSLRARPPSKIEDMP